MDKRYFLTTTRLGFREWNLGDIELAASIWQDAKVTELMGGPLSLSQIHSRLVTENRLLRMYSIQFWPVFLKDTHEFVGCCGLRPYKPSEKIFEIRVYIKHDMWGKGLATEAAHAIIDHAFTNLGATALFAGHHPNNNISKKLLEHSGFQYAYDEFYEPTQLDHPSYLLQYKNYCTYCLK